MKKRIKKTDFRMTNAAFKGAMTALAAIQFAKIMEKMIFSNAPYGKHKKAKKKKNYKNGGVR
jgi:hypothetical protein